MIMRLGRIQLVGETMLQALLLAGGLVSFQAQAQAPALLCPEAS